MVPLLICLILCCQFLFLWQNHPNSSLVCRQLCYLDNSQSLPLGMAFLHLHQKQSTFPFLVERTPKPRIFPPFLLLGLSYHQLKAFWEAAVVLGCTAREGLGWPPGKSSCGSSIPLPTGPGARDMELPHCPHSRRHHCFPSPLLPSLEDAFRLLSSVPLLLFPVRSTVVPRCTFTAIGKITGSPLTPLSPLSPLDPWREITGEQQPNYYHFMKKKKKIFLYNVLWKSREYSNIFRVRDMLHYWYCNRTDAKDCRTRDSFSPDNYFKYVLSGT